MPPGESATGVGGGIVTRSCGSSTSRATCSTGAPSPTSASACSSPTPTATPSTSGRSRSRPRQRAAAGSTPSRQRRPVQPRTDTGLRHSFVDRDVVNGQTYYYALVAYDRGLSPATPTAPSRRPPTGSVDGLSPSITTAVINNDIAGNVVDRPQHGRRDAARAGGGLVAPGRRATPTRRRGTAAVDLTIVSPARSTRRRRYELRFTNPSVWNTDLTPTYQLVDTATGEVRRRGAITPGPQRAPAHGRVRADDHGPRRDRRRRHGRRVHGRRRRDVHPRRAPGDRLAGRPRRAVHPVPVRLRGPVGAGRRDAETSLVLAFGQRASPLPFQVWNPTLDRQQDVILVEDVPDLRELSATPATSSSSSTA